MNRMQKTAAAIGGIDLKQFAIAVAVMNGAYRKVMQDLSDPDQALAFNQVVGSAATELAINVLGLDKEAVNAAARELMQIEEEDEQ